MRWVHAAPEACILVIGPAERPSDPPRDPARIDYLLGLGDPGGIAALLDDVLRSGIDTSGGQLRGAAAFATVRRVFVQDGTFDGAAGAEVHLALGLPPAASRWKWMWADAPLHVGASARGGEVLTVERLTAGPATGATATEIGECLERAFPNASVGPHAAEALGWWGVRDHGRLVGVTSALRVADGGAPHLSALGVDPVARGRGLGKALLAAAVADLLEEGYRFASLGVYTANEPAWSMYERIGFQHGPSFTTYSLD